MLIIMKLFHTDSVNVIMQQRRDNDDYPPLQCMYTNNKLTP